MAKSNVRKSVSANPWATAKQAVIKPTPHGSTVATAQGRIQTQMNNMNNQALELMRKIQAENAARQSATSAANAARASLDNVRGGYSAVPVGSLTTRNPWAHPYGQFPKTATEDDKSEGG